MEKTQSASISIIDRFASVDDPRMERAGKRNLGDIIAGADNRVDIESLAVGRRSRRLRIRRANAVRPR